MKNISKYIPLLLLVTLFCGCDEDAIDPLTGKYPIPVEYTLNNLQSQDVSTLSNERYLFTLELTDDKNVLHLEMVGDLYYLPGQTYTLYVKGTEPDADEYGGTGTFAHSYFTAADGSSNQTAIVSGSLNVKKQEDNYTLSGALTLENELVIRVQSAFTAVYEKPELPLITLTKVLGVTNNVPNGTNTITLQLGTDGITATPGAFGTTYRGTGNYLAVDFYSEDGTLSPGTYTPADNGNAASGNYVSGYDPGDIFGMGIPFTNWGTCWWTVTDGVTSAIHVNQGDIVVEKSESVYTITLQNDRINTAFSGEISDL